MPFARHRLLLSAATVAALLAGCNTGGPAYDLPAGLYAEVIDMTSTLAFSPQTVTIRAGETVLWRNKSVWAHTVTFDPTKAATRTDVVLPAGAEPFASGDIEPGETFARKFTVPGTYRYVCLHHQDADMEGTIIVSQ